MINVSVLFKSINSKLLRFRALVQFSVIEYKYITQIFANKLYTCTADAQISFFLAPVEKLPHVESSDRSYFSSKVSATYWPAAIIIKNV